MWSNRSNPLRNYLRYYTAILQLVVLEVRPVLEAPEAQQVQQVLRVLEFQDTP